MFDRVGAENGGVLYDPVTGCERALAGAPPLALVQKLMSLNVEPLSLGRTIVATWQPNEPNVLAAIAELGLDHQIIFNKGAVMVLPAGVNKGTGLAAALNELELSASNVVGAGDAENDLAFLTTCGCSGTVAIGDEFQAGSIAEAVRLLARGVNVAFGTVAITLDARRQLFEHLVPQLIALKRARARPHSLIVDEAHHYLPSSCEKTGRTLMKEGDGLVLATIQSGSLQKSLLRWIISLHSAAPP